MLTNIIAGLAIVALVLLVVWKWVLSKKDRAAVREVRDDLKQGYTEVKAVVEKTVQNVSNTSGPADVLATKYQANTTAPKE